MRTGGPPGCTWRWDCPLFLCSTSIHPPGTPSLRLSARQGTMSSAVPKSDSTTSLLRSSGLKSRSVHSSGAPRDHRSHRAHHHPSRAGGRDDPRWTEDCETSARRPLCQPRYAGSRGDPLVQRCHSHEHESLTDDDCGPEEARKKTSRHQKERSRSMKSKHPPHHHQDSARGEPPPAAHQHGSSRQDRRTSPTPSHSKQTDDAAFFFETRKRVTTGSFSSLSSSDPPGTSAPVRPAAAGRASKRLSVTASEYDSSLHPIVKSVFGQVRKVWRLNNNNNNNNYLSCANGAKTKVEFPAQLSG